MQSRISRSAARRGAGLLLVATSAIVLAACGGNSKDTNKNDGTGTAPTASTSTTTASTTTETTAAAADGMKIFSNNCSICHGAKGEGGNGGPPITTKTDAASNIKQVTNGGGGMPAFGNQLSPEEIKAVATYVAGTLAK